MSEEPSPDHMRDMSVDESILEKQTRLTRALGGILNLMTAFAAPRYLAQIDDSKLGAHEKVLALYDDFLAMFDTPENTVKDARILVPAREMRRLLDTWSITRVAPEAVITAAREFLAGMGVPEPDEGWDLWEPPREEPP